MALSFRQVRYFIATAESGKVSSAAAELGVSQSAITSAIKGLERELDTTLFRRRSNGVSLTYQGHQFLKHAHNIVAAISEASRSVRRDDEDVAGTIDVAVTYTVVGYFLSPLLARFMRSFPNTVVRLHEMDRLRMEDEVVKGNVDLAVMLVSNLENRAEIASDLLLRSLRRCWAAVDHPLLQKEAVTLADVAAEPYIMLTVDEADQTAMRYWSKARLEPRVIFSTSSVEAVRSMVAAGMGVTILSDMVYRPWSLEGQKIDLRQVVEPVPSMDVGIAWRRSAEMRRPARAFAEFLRLGAGGSPQSYPE